MIILRALHIHILNLIQLLLGGGAVPKVYVLHPSVYLSIDRSIYVHVYTHIFNLRPYIKNSVKSVKDHICFSLGGSSDRKSAC